MNIYNTYKNILHLTSSSIKKKIFIHFIVLIKSFIFLSCGGNCVSQNIRKKNISSYQLLIKDFNSKTNIISVSSNEYLLDLKKKIRDITGVKEDCQGLLYQGKICFDDSKKIQYYFNHLDIITLYSTLKGGGDTFKFVNFDRNTQPYKVFSTTAPRWRIIYSGINMEGVCNNSICDANNQRVWCNLKTTKGKQKKRYRGSIDDDEDDADEQFIDPIMVSSIRYCCYCPACDTKINHKTVKWFGFYDCRYDICGLNYDTDKQESNRGNSISRGNGFIYFNGSEEDIKTWLHIRVVVRKL